MHIESGGGHPAAVQRLEQGFAVHQIASSRVDESHPRLDAGESLASQQMVCLGRQLGVQGDEIRGLEQLPELEQLDAKRLRGLSGDEGIVGHDVHPHCAAAGRDLATDTAQSDDAEALLAQLDSTE